MGANLIIGMRVDRRGVTVGVCAIGLGRRGTVLVMAGTLPGMLFRVNRMCDRFVVFNICFLVGLGAAMIAGASVICRNN